MIGDGDLAVRDPDAPADDSAAWRRVLGLADADLYKIGY